MPLIFFFLLPGLIKKNNLSFKYHLHGTTELEFYQAINFLNKVLMGQNFIGQLTANSRTRLDTIKHMSERAWYTQNFPPTDINRVVNYQNFQNYFKAIEFEISNPKIPFNPR